MGTFRCALACFVASLPVSSGVGVRQEREDRLRVSNAGVDCDLLADLEINGKQMGNMAVMVCSNWPASFGPFPFNFTSGDVSVVMNLLNGLLQVNGVWDAFQEDLKDETERKNIFCRKQEVLRDVKEDASQKKVCPPTLNEENLVELSTDGTDVGEQIAQDGQWACKDGDNEDCNCQRRDNPSADFKTAFIGKRPNGCKMVHKGVCYGTCPKGYARTFLQGLFRPVCSSICADTNHRVKCGVGCARSRRDCSLVLVEQGRQVMRKIAADPRQILGDVLSGAKKAMEDIVSFTLTTWTTALARAKGAAENFVREELEFGLVVTFYQFIMERAEQSGGNIFELDLNLRNATKLAFDLADAVLGWDSVDSGWLSDIFTENTQGVKSFFDSIEAFRFNDCEIAGDKVSFSIENAGDARVTGPWEEAGVKDGRPRYELTSGESSSFEYDKRKKVWKVHVLDKTKGLGRWFSWFGFGWREMYRSTEDSASAPQDGWQSVQGALPSPDLVPTVEL